MKAVNRLFILFVPFLTLNAQNNVDFLCFGSQSETYSISSEPGMSYSWIVNYGGVINGLNTGTTIDVDWSATPIGTYVNAIELTVTDNATNCSAQVLLDVEIIENPVLTLSLSQNQICIGESVNVSVSSTNPGDTYSWTPNTLTGNGGSLSPAVTTNVTVIATGPIAGCTTTATDAIVVNPLPTVAVSFDNNSICLGDELTVSATPGYVSYAWTPNTITGSSSTITPSSSSEGTYQVTVTDANNCENTAVNTLTISDPANINLSVDNSIICLGETVNFNVTSDVAISQYVWASPIISSTSTSSYTPNNVTETDYSVQVTDVNGCNATDNISITINTLPTPGPIIFTNP
jgi:hypothetical protein